MVLSLSLLLAASLGLFVGVANIRESMTMLQGTDESDLSALLFSLPKANSTTTNIHSSDAGIQRPLFLSGNLMSTPSLPNHHFSWTTTAVAPGGSYEGGHSLHTSSSPSRSSTILTLPRSHSAPRLLHFDRDASPSPSTPSTAACTGIFAPSASNANSYSHSHAIPSGPPHRSATLGELQPLRSPKPTSPSCCSPLAGRHHATITIHNATTNAFPTHPPSQCPTTSVSPASAVSASAFPSCQSSQNNTTSTSGAAGSPLPLAGSVTGMSASCSLTNGPVVPPLLTSERPVVGLNSTTSPQQGKVPGKSKTARAKNRRVHIGITNAIDLHSLKSPKDTKDAGSSSTHSTATGVLQFSGHSARPAPSKVLDFLYLGAVEDATDAAFLSAHNVTTILNISEEEYWCPQRHIVVHPFVIDDSSTADISALFAPTRALLDRARSQYYKVRRQQEELVRRGEVLPTGTLPPPCILVHCQKGRSRSAAIVTAYLMYRNGWSVDQALKFLRQRRPSVEPNIGFLNALRMFQDSMMTMEKRLRRFHQLSAVVKNIAGDRVTEEMVRTFFEEHIGAVRDVAIHHRGPNPNPSSKNLTSEVSKSGDGTPLADRKDLVSFADHSEPEGDSRSSSSTAAAPSETDAEANGNGTADIPEEETTQESATSSPPSACLTLCLVYFACSEDVARAEELAAAHPDLLRAALGSEKDIRVKASIKIRPQQRK